MRTASQVASDLRKARRPRPVRGFTLKLRAVQRQRAGWAADVAAVGPYERPKTRAECEGHARPCPFVSCRWHLYLDVTIGGSIRLNFPDIEPADMTDSCVLDIADRGGMTLEEVGAAINLTRERVRQLEVSALSKVAPNMSETKDDVANSEPVKRRLRIIANQKRYEARKAERERACR